MVNDLTDAVNQRFKNYDNAFLIQIQDKKFTSDKICFNPHNETRANLTP